MSAPSSMTSASGDCWMRRADHPILLDPPVLLAAIWAVVALAAARRRLRRVGLEAAVPAAPRLPARAVRGVSAVLARRRATCLERSLVLQRWLVAQGSAPDVLIGVAPDGGRTGSGRDGPAWDLHAWIDGIDHDHGTHRVLHRVPPPA